MYYNHIVKTKISSAAVGDVCNARNLLLRTTFKPHLKKSIFFHSGSTLEAQFTFRFNGAVYNFCQCKRNTYRAEASHRVPMVTPINGLQRRHTDLSSVYQSLNSIKLKITVRTGKMTAFVMWITSTALMTNPNVSYVLCFRLK